MQDMFDAAHYFEEAFPEHWRILSLPGNEVRQNAVIDMVFNMGIGTIRQFVLFLEAILRQDWDWAYVEMLNSKWAEQVGFRAGELARDIRTGKHVRHTYQSF